MQSYQLPCIYSLDSILMHQKNIILLMALMLRDYIITAILILLTRLIALANHVESPFLTRRSGWPKKLETARKIYSITFLYLKE